MLLDRAQHSSGEFVFPKIERLDDVQRKHRQLAELAAVWECDGCLLRDPANINWLTSGMSRRPGVGESALALYVGEDTRAVLCDNTESLAIFDEDLGGLGFSLKQRPWMEPREVLLEEICSTRRLLLDAPLRHAREGIVRPGIFTELRCQLSPIERERLRRLGAKVTRAVEATARTLEQGQTENEIAGQLAYRLLRQNVQPVRLRAVADGRLNRYRNWERSELPCKAWVTISACGMADGLHVTATRSVVLGPGCEQLLIQYEQVGLVAATAIHFSRAGESFGDVWKRVRRIYEKIGIPNEWLANDQAELIGYRPCEESLLPDSVQTLEEQTALHWHPQVGGCLMGDSVLVTEGDPEVITSPGDWPLMTIEVRGIPVTLPDVLIRWPQ
jgi:Xaa-Pro aminopeptidase